MHAAYRDILSRISDPPQWWDERGVPRFDAFTPQQLADIYADQCVLLEIACQRCDTRFKVAMSQVNTGQKIRLLDGVATLEYGDPPNVSCCRSGASMGSIPLRVLEAWNRIIVKMRWERIPEAEREIDCAWS